MDFVPMLAAAFLVKQIIDFVKYLKGKEWNGVITVLSVWLAGVVVITLLAQTDFADSINVLDRTLSSLNFATQVFLGLTIGSVGSFANEVTGAIDSTRSTAKPTLTGSPPEEN